MPPPNATADTSAFVTVNPYVYQNALAQEQALFLLVLALAFVLVGLGLIFRETLARAGARAYGTFVENRRVLIAYRDHFEHHKP